MAAKAHRAFAITVYATVLIALVIGGAVVFWKDAVDRWMANHIATVGGPFALTDQNGKPFTRDDLLGHPHIVYFGFTLCPDLCPTTLFLLASIVDTLGEKAKPLKVVFVSVDPERDSVDVMKEYVGAFHDDFIGLTGSPAAIEAAAKAYRIYYRKVDLDDGDYTVDHTATAMLFNPDGSFADAILYDESKESALAKVERLLAANEAH